MCIRDRSKRNRSRPSRHLASSNQVEGEKRVKDRSTFVQAAQSGCSCAEFPVSFLHCHGTEFDHEDGSTTCSLQDQCEGSDAIHFYGESCTLRHSCDRCGPDRG